MPRPETETLVEQALARIRPGDRVLDLGTGSGAIAIAWRQRRKGAGSDILAVDRSERALGWRQRTPRRSDARCSYSAATGSSAFPRPFELIVANPPYIAEVIRIWRAEL